MKTPNLTLAQKAQILGDSMSNISFPAPRQMISLWDMIQFHAREFVLLFEELDASILLVHDKPGRETTEPEKRRFRDLARRLCNECHKYNLKGSARHADFLYTRLTEDLNQSRPAPARQRAFSALEEDFREIHDEITEELRGILLVVVQRANADYYERDDLFGVKIAASDEMNREIRAAGNCLASELHTAAVFHSMGFVNLALIAIARHLHVIIKKTPLEFAEWQKMIDKVQLKLRNKSIAPGKGRMEKERIRRFCNKMIDKINAYKDIRNAVCHTRANHSAQEAFAIFESVKEFAKALVEHNVPLK